MCSRIQAAFGRIGPAGVVAGVAIGHGGWVVVIRAGGEEKAEAEVKAEDEGAGRRMAGRGCHQPVKPTPVNKLALPESGVFHALYLIYR
ncbi:MAG: hypothetical protein ACE5D7_07035 [Fidelibacterota bacterium]